MAFLCLPLQAQDPDYQLAEADTILVDSVIIDHPPRKAALYSAVLPGMGQIYNKKYWKLPLVYAGIGGLGYAAIWNSREYDYYFDLYKFMTDNGYQEWEGRTFREVEWYKNTHLRYKNLFIILTVGFYVLQIVDATVDAHLIDFDISENLSMRIDPVLYEPAFYKTARSGNLSDAGTLGLRFCLNF